MAKTERQVLSNLYAWSVQETEREIDLNFPTLSRLKNGSAAIYIEFLCTLDIESRLGAAKALIKRFYLPILQMKGDKFTARDQQLVKSFLEFSRFRSFGMKSPGAKSLGTMNKKVLIEAVETRLAPVLGEATCLGSTEWRYELTVGSYRIISYVDMGGRLPLKYHHAIFTTAGKRVHQGVSILQWHGIASQTSWDIVTHADAKSTACLLAELCMRFMQTAHLLFE